MTHQDDPATFRYDPTANLFCERSTRFYRSSREAYGTSIYFEKPNHDLMWAVTIAFALGILAVAVVWLRS